MIHLGVAVIATRFLQLPLFARERMRRIKIRTLCCWSLIEGDLLCLFQRFCGPHGIVSCSAFWGRRPFLASLQGCLLYLHLSHSLKLEYRLVWLPAVIIGYDCSDHPQIQYHELYRTSPAQVNGFPLGSHSGLQLQPNDRLLEFDRPQHYGFGIL